MPLRIFSVLIAAVFCLTATAGPAAQLAPAKQAVHPFSRAQLIAMLRKRVKHVFVIYQENRSFDSYFGTYPGAEGLYSHPPAQTPGFTQNIVDTDGTMRTIEPFRIGPKESAADTDDIDHSHTRTVAKMNVGADGRAAMDHFAQVEELKYTTAGSNPSLLAKQMGELAMAHEDCDTIPFLWLYAKRFVLFDHVFEQMTGPSTPGNLAIIGAQSGESQAMLEPAERSRTNGDDGASVPVLNDDDPFWGSPSDKGDHKMPVNPKDFTGTYPYGTQINLLYPTLPLTLAGRDLPGIAAKDRARANDYEDIDDDVPAIAAGQHPAVPWGWYEEGFDREPTDGPDPLDANGNHASYVTHHNGPQYFGYVANNDAMRAHLHGLNDLREAIAKRALPASGVFYVKGGYQNLMGLAPANPDPKIQANFIGDDDHPGYSDSQISEAMVADLIDRIARSVYWKDSAIVLTWDDSEGDYDHVPPPRRAALPFVGQISDGPRIPLLVISPFARSGFVSHDVGDTASVVKLVDSVFGVMRLASLPDQQRARAIAKDRFGSSGIGARDSEQNGISDLLSAFDPARLLGKKSQISASEAQIPDHLVRTLPASIGYGCVAIGVTPVDVARRIANPIPLDFNPRPKTNPTRP